MPLDRRRLLRSAPPFLLASCAPSLFAPAMAAKRDLPVALLIPRTGEHAALGLSMERAARLAQGDNAGNALTIYDTNGNGGAAGAARDAIRGGARLVLGPLLAAEVRPVLAELRGRAPVIAFSNDMALRESGAFLIGITARQTVGRILDFAAGRGIRRVAVAIGEGAWDAQVRAAAQAAGPQAGLALQIVNAADFAGPTLRRAPDALPDAVLFADAAALAAAVPALTAGGVQPLAALPELDLAPTALAGIAGTWLAAPDPARVGQFVEGYEARIGTRPGLIAGLAHDAGAIAASLRKTGTMDRAALLDPSGFAGVCGRVRFREDGSATRTLAILEILPDQVRAVQPEA